MNRQQIGHEIPFQQEIEWNKLLSSRLVQCKDYTKTSLLFKFNGLKKQQQHFVSSCAYQKKLHSFECNLKYFLSQTQCLHFKSYAYMRSMITTRPFTHKNTFQLIFSV